MPCGVWINGWNTAESLYRCFPFHVVLPCSLALCRVTEWKLLEVQGCFASSAGQTAQLPQRCPGIFPSLSLSTEGPVLLPMKTSQRPLPLPYNQIIRTRRLSEASFNIGDFYKYSTVSRGFFNVCIFS